MTIEKVKSAREVIDDFLEAKHNDTELDSRSVTAVSDLWAEGKLTKTNLLRRLEGEREAALQASGAAGGETADGQA